MLVKRVTEAGAGAGVVELKGIKKVNVTISNDDVKIESQNLSLIIQTMEFFGQTQFNRLMEEYQNFCRNNSSEFQFHVQYFHIKFEEIQEVVL